MTTASDARRHGVPEQGRRVIGRGPRADAWLLGMAICAVPASIAIAESLLAASLVWRVIALVRGRTKLRLPRVFWFWFAWAALEVVAWLGSPNLRAGEGEMRHLILIAALFLQVPAIASARDYVTVWRGIVLSASLSSLVLIGHFLWRLHSYSGTSDPVLYLRDGGLLHHWMVYGTVEIMVFAGLIQLWHFYPQERWWLLPVALINVVAMVLSLTRMVWLCSLAVLAAHLIWTRSRWIWAVPAIPCVLFLIAPGAVRSRVEDSMRPEYYSNAERLQMLRAGWKMIREHPIAGVGPGRVDGLYTSYLDPGETIPAYHGHLHNNAVQIAAEFGLPVLGAAFVCLMSALRGLKRRCAFVTGRDWRFLCRTALLGLLGFVASGMFDYTYGHSLGLMLLAFSILPPLV